MNWLERHSWGPPLLVELASFAVAFAVFAMAGGLYVALSGHHGRPIWWVLLPAAIVVAIVLPLIRRPIATAVDRLAHGPQAEGYRMMADLMARMAATLEVDEVMPRLAETAARSVHSQRGRVSVWLADGRQWNQTWSPGFGAWAASLAERNGVRPNVAGDPVIMSASPSVATLEREAGADEAEDDLDEAAEVMVEVQHRGDVVGELGVGLTGSMSDADRRALNDLAGPAGGALAIVRLTTELRRQIAEATEETRELQASRERLVETRRRVQQRTWTRLSATVIPRVSAIAGSLDEFRAATEAGGGSDRYLQVARRAAAEALEELREIARGVFPATLADSGLAAALEAWAERRSLDRQFSVVGDLRPLHGYPAAETAIYYACTLALEDAGAASAGGADRDRPPAIVLDGDSQVATATIPLLATPREATARAIRDWLEALGGSLRIDGATGEEGDSAGDSPADPPATLEAGQWTYSAPTARPAAGPVDLVATIPLREP